MSQLQDRLEELKLAKGLADQKRTDLTSKAEADALHNLLTELVAQVGVAARDSSGMVEITSGLNHRLRKIETKPWWKRFLGL